MTASLHAFFGAMRPFLLSETSVDQVRSELGPPPSGDANLEFYRTLVERNLFKILRDLYGPVRELALRAEAGTWPRLVRGYVQQHPPRHWDPNRFGESFSDFLAQQRDGDATIPALWEEMADFCWIRHRANVCADDVSDPFERSLFVRQYTYDVPGIVAAVTADPAASLPTPRPYIVVVYRHVRTMEVRLLTPNATGLAALARRQGQPLPAALQRIDEADLQAADVFLVEHGILTPRDSEQP
jgi:hypothetical protein